VNAAGVYALLADPALDAPLAAGFEEEGVPLAHAEGAADALQLAREAARRSALGIGIGGDGERLILLLASGSGPPGSLPDGRCTAMRAGKPRPLEDASLGVGAGSCPAPTSRSAGRRRRPRQCARLDEWTNVGQSMSTTSQSVA
jgi:hypothetical protein